MGHVMKRWLIVAGLLAAMPLAAQGEAPVVLWGQFTTATTKAEAKQFRASLPKARLEVIPGCLAPFGYRTIKDRLVTITFMAQDGDADCHARLLRQFRAELGEPETDQVTFGSVIGYGGGAVLDTTSPGVALIWREGEKKTKLIKTPGNGYNLIFTVREDKYLY
jgi:hypothetical protein